MGHITGFHHTGNVEVYHSVMTKYCPKREHFDFDAMCARTQLAVLDQRIVERPQFYLLAISADTPEDKLMYVNDRPADIQQLSLPVPVQGVTTPMHAAMRASQTTQSSSLRPASIKVLGMWRKGKIIQEAVNMLCRRAVVHQQQAEDSHSRY